MDMTAPPGALSGPPVGAPATATAPRSNAYHGEWSEHSGSWLLFGTAGCKKCITTTVQEFYLVFRSKITVMWAVETITDV